MEYATARIGFCRVLVSLMPFHGQEVGPAILGTSFANQLLWFLLGVGGHYEGNRVGPDWTWTPQGRVELECEGDG